MRNGLVLVALASLLLAGCAGGGDAGDAQSPSPAATPEATETSASIAGVVLNQELMPVSGAQVAIRELSQLTETDAQGNFTFNDLDEGVYTVDVQRLGYESTARKVPVAVGQVASVEVVLRPIELPQEVYSVANPVSAHITLGHAWSDYYGAWDFLPLCTQCEFYVPLTPGPSDIENEAWWEKPINADVFSHEIYYLLRQSVANETAAALEDSSTRVTSGYWGYGEMPRPMEEDDYDEALENLAAETDVLQVRVGGGFYSVAYEQRVDIWITFAYNGELPDGYTAFPPPESETAGLSEDALLPHLA